MRSPTSSRHPNFHAWIFPPVRACRRRRRHRSEEREFSAWFTSLTYTHTRSNLDGLDQSSLSLSSACIIECAGRSLGPPVSFSGYSLCAYVYIYIYMGGRDAGRWPADKPNLTEAFDRKKSWPSIRVGWTVRGEERETERKGRGRSFFSFLPPRGRQREEARIADQLDSLMGVLSVNTWSVRRRDRIRIYLSSLELWFSTRSRTLSSILLREGCLVF